MQKIAISVGDINGVGLELLLRCHDEVSRLCEPMYCVDQKLLDDASELINIKKRDYNTKALNIDAKIEIGKVTKTSGDYSYNSFLKAIKLAKNKDVDAIVTLPIHKEAWSKAGINYVGHTDMLRDVFKADAIMMLGCNEMFVALFTEHIPLKEVASNILYSKLYSFLNDFTSIISDQKIAVLGLNPHAGDNGVLGDEEKIIIQVINDINSKNNNENLVGPIVPDIAFTPRFRKNYNYFIAMYHDQGLAPLKALYFDQSINVSLNLPIIRTSVDHGTAFDIAYKGVASTQSYINAIKSAIEFSNKYNKL